MFRMLLTLTACLVFSHVQAEPLTTPSGLTTSLTVYGEAKKPVVLIFMHGKGSEPDKPDYRALYSRLNDAGYQVIAPRMPWAGEQWTGSLQQALELVDAAVVRVEKSGKQAVVAGHSYGGMGAILYRPSNAPSSVSGRVMLAAGGMIDLFPRLNEKLVEEVARARQMLTEGKAGQTERFSVTNIGKGNKVFIDTLIATPEIMLSYHDPSTFPNTKAALAQITQPVFWAIGSKDGITYNRKPLFDLLPPRPENAYAELPAGHVDLLERVAEPLIEWLDKLPVK